MPFLPLATSALDVLVAYAPAIGGGFVFLVVAYVTIRNRKWVSKQIRSSKLGMSLGLITAEELEADERELTRLKADQEFTEALEALEDEFLGIKKSSDRYPKIAETFGIDEEELKRNQAQRIEDALNQVRAAVKAVVRLHEATDMAAHRRRTAAMLTRLKKRAAVEGIAVEAEQAFEAINDIVLEFGELATEVDEAEAEAVSDAKELAKGAVRPIYQEPVPVEEVEVETETNEVHSRQAEDPALEPPESDDEGGRRKLIEPELA